MHNLVIDLGRGLVIACGLFVLLWVIMALGWIMSIKEDNLRRDAENAAFERGMGQAEARKIEAEARKVDSNLVPRKVIETVVYEKYPRMGPRAARRN